MRGEVIAMDGYILRNRQEQLTLPADAADKLLQSGQGDAALLYLALRRFGRGVTPEELEKVLPISRLRIDAAEKVLQDLDLLPRPARQAPPDPADERPVYTAQDIAGLLTDNEGFERRAVVYPDGAGNARCSLFGVPLGTTYALLENGVQRATVTLTADEPEQLVRLAP